MITSWDFKFAKKIIYPIALNLKASNEEYEMKSKKISRRHQFWYEKELVICV